MGNLVLSLSDLTIFTNDNPRDEDPNQIIDQIVQGCTKEVHIEPDRMKAIQFALESCTKNDIIILLGKGEESTLFSGGKMIAASDKEVVSRWIKEENIWGNIFLC